MANEKRHEELKHAAGKLELLAKAITLVKADSTAAGILEELLGEGTADGTPTHVYDLADVFPIAFATAHARALKEGAALAAEQEGAAA